MSDKRTSVEGMSKARLLEVISDVQGDVEGQPDSATYTVALSHNEQTQSVTLIIIPDL